LAVGSTETGIRRAYGAGISSTGMYMRDFLYLGFNEDEAHRKVFDAVQIAIPGTHRLLANVEFSDPNTYSRQDMWHDSLSYSYPPLTFGVTTDPISGVRDGILKRPATDPLVFQVDSSNEFWQMNASLNVHDGQGRPVPFSTWVSPDCSIRQGSPGCASCRRKATAGRQRCARCWLRSTTGPIAGWRRRRATIRASKTARSSASPPCGRRFRRCPAFDCRRR
jgi:hypothetical protein